mmetsp:Transcript_4836/g.11815  ORF Transcript_4836/g.11815 Transcript_4836/m.11815 type:complete len:147 (-) Transcript_4836:137-577(-)
MPTSLVQGAADRCTSLVQPALLLSRWWSACWMQAQMQTFWTRRGGVQRTSPEASAMAASWKVCSPAALGNDVATSVMAAVPNHRFVRLEVLLRFMGPSADHHRARAQCHVVLLRFRGFSAPPVRIAKRWSLMACHERRIALLVVVL